MCRNTKIHKNFFVLPEYWYVSRTVKLYKNSIQHNNWNLAVVLPVDFSSWLCPNTVLHSFGYVEERKKIKYFCL